MPSFATTRNNTIQRRVAVVTGTRADYGLLYWLIADLTRRPSLDLQLIVTGTHLSPEFGLTVKAIEADGFPIAARCDIVMSGDSPAAICASLGLALVKLGDVFDRLRPDVVVVLGDRYEALAAACAALISRIPIAHIHGGETTEGAIDEAIRHSITKMASLHFVAAEPYKRRVIQLGEHPERVFTVGAMACESLRRSRLMSRRELEVDLGRGLRAPLFLVTYHPTTLRRESPARPVAELLAALDEFQVATMVLTRGNADTDGRVINAMFDEYAQRYPDRVYVYAALGQSRYLSLLHEADAVIGNSSSGIIEAPLVGTPTVNIGDRQKGRLRTPSIVDCAETANDIAGAIRVVLQFQRGHIPAAGAALYAHGGGVESIISVIEQADLDTLRFKRFHDLGPSAFDESLAAREHGSPRT